MTTPYYECPRFDKCNVNNCPLHPFYPDLIVDPEDRELKCTIEKQVRFKIGSKYPDILKYQGLSRPEYTGKQRFENLSEQDKEIVRERAKGLILSSCQSKVSGLIVLDGVSRNE